MLQRVRATSAQPEIADAIRSELSDREIQVLKLIANGKDNALIAAELHISPKTVKNHISNILMKLQIDNRIQAAVYAVRSRDRLEVRVPEGARVRLEPAEHRPELPELDVRVGEPPRRARRAPSAADGSCAVPATSPSRRSTRRRSASSASASA